MTAQASRMARGFEPQFTLSANPDRSARRIARLDQAISSQRSFLFRVPDPDTRERAEVHLYRLISMRDHLLRAQSATG